MYIYIYIYTRWVGRSVMYSVRNRWARRQSLFGTHRPASFNQLRLTSFDSTSRVFWKRKSISMHTKISATDNKKEAKCIPNRAKMVAERPRGVCG